MDDTTSATDSTESIRPWAWLAHHIPASKSPSPRTFVRPRIPDASSATSENVASGRLPISATCSETEFRATLAVLRNSRKTITVSLGVGHDLRLDVVVDLGLSSCHEPS